MFHIQRTVPDWLQAVERLPDGALVKAVDQGQVFQEVKAINPTIYTNLRHYYDSGQVFGGSWEDNLDRARAFFSSFVDGTFRTHIAPYCNSIGEFNEYLANSQTSFEIAQRLMWARAAAHVWQTEYRIQDDYQHIRLSLCAAAVGNDIHEGFAGLLDYHPYTHWQNKQRSSWDWAGLSGRWEQMDIAYRKLGYHVDWLFGEAGPFEAAETGWRSSECLGGDRALYVEAVRQWLQNVQQTHAYQSGRIRTCSRRTPTRAGASLASPCSRPTATQTRAGSHSRRRSRN
jgi:hypothetical protein